MFVTPDSIVPRMYDPQSLNRYAYCRNNPLIYVDPSGHKELVGDDKNGLPITTHDGVHMTDYRGKSVYENGRRTFSQWCKDITKKMELFNLNYWFGKGNVSADMLNNYYKYEQLGSQIGKMRLSQAGINFIIAREGFRAFPYNDSMGYATIGYGHLMHKSPVTAADKALFPNGLSKEDAYALFCKDAQVKVDAVNSMVNAPLTQNMFDALVSFAFNVGEGALQKSTLLGKLNAGDYIGAWGQFDRWHIPAEIISRRNKERDMFIQGYEPMF